MVSRSTASAFAIVCVLGLPVRGDPVAAATAPKASLSAYRSYAVSQAKLHGARLRDRHPLARELAGLKTVPATD